MSSNLSDSLNSRWSPNVFITIMSELKLKMGFFSYGLLLELELDDSYLVSVSF